MDLVMLTLLNAQERSATEFRALFAAASPGFRFEGVTRPKGCRMSIIEAVWEGEDYSVEPPTPVDTPLVTPSESPIDAKTDQDKTLPLPSPKTEPKIEEEEMAVAHNETTESSCADTSPEATDEVTKKTESLFLNSYASSTSPQPASITTQDTSSSTLA